MEASRLYAGSESVEVEWTVGPLRVARDISVSVQSDLDSGTSLLSVPPGPRDPHLCLAAPLTGLYDLACTWWLLCRVVYSNPFGDGSLEG